MDANEDENKPNVPISFYNAKMVSNQNSDNEKDNIDEKRNDEIDNQVTVTEQKAVNKEES